MIRVAVRAELEPLLADPSLAPEFDWLSRPGHRRSSLQPARDLGGRPRRAARRPARGIGLGRALLRWAVGWLERKEAPRAWLMVDGDNESALRLYRSEGFEVTRTRHVWSQPDTA